MLRMSATFARILNIEEGNEVSVSSVLNPPYLSSLTVTPWNIEDWDIVVRFFKIIIDSGVTKLL